MTKQLKIDTIPIQTIGPKGLVRDPILEAWFVRKLANVAVPPFKAIVEPQTRVSVERPTAIRPSNLAGCERKIVLQEAAIQACAGPWIEVIPAALATKFDFGTHIHRTIQGAIPELAHEIKVSYKTLQGTLDTRANRTVIDYKSIDKKGFSALKRSGVAREDHAGQNNLYSVADGAEKSAVLYILKDGETEAKLDADHLLAFSGPSDVALADLWDDKAERIRDHVKAGSLPAYESVLECRWCGRKSECWARLAQDTELHSRIVGVTFSDFARVVGELSPGENLDLVWNGANEHGSRLADNPELGAAVEVRRKDGTLLGHLPDEGSGSPTAQILAKHLRNGGRAVTTITEITGGTEDKPNNGCNLLLLLSN